MLAALGNFEGVALLIRNVEKTIVEHLVDVAVPIEVGQILARTVGFELVVAMLQHGLVAHAAQDVNQQVDGHALLRAGAGRERLLGQQRAIEGGGWVAANVAVAAVVAQVFGKIVQQNATTAAGGLGKLLHAL